MDYKKVLETGKECYHEVLEYMYIHSDVTVESERDVQAILIQLMEHVEREYSCDSYKFDYNLRHAKPSPRNYFQISCNPYSKKIGFTIEAQADSSTLNYVVSVLHEVGHMIDARKRGHHTVFMNFEKKEERKSEIEAWKQGLRFGLVFGYVSKEEVEFHFNDCIVALATYYRTGDLKENEKEIEKAITEIREYIYS